MVMRWIIHNTYMCGNDQWDKCNDLLSKDNIFFSQGSWKWGAPLNSLVSVNLEWKELCRWLLPHACMCKVGLSNWFRPSVSQPVCQWNFETIFLQKGLDDLANPTRNIHRKKLCILVHVCMYTWCGWSGCISWHFQQFLLASLMPKQKNHLVTRQHHCSNGSCPGSCRSHSMGIVPSWYNKAIGWIWLVKFIYNWQSNFMESCGVVRKLAGP